MDEDIMYLCNWGIDIISEIRDKYNTMKADGKGNQEAIKEILKTMSPDNIQRTYLIYKTLSYMYRNEFGFNKNKYDSMYVYYEDLYHPYFDLYDLFDCGVMLNNVLVKYMPERPKETNNVLICEEDFSDYEGEYEDF